MSSLSEAVRVLESLETIHERELEDARRRIAELELRNHALVAAATELERQIAELEARVA